MVISSLATGWPCRSAVTAPDEHGVGLAGVAHGLVRQHAGQVGRQHHHLLAAARGHRMALGLQVAVQHVQPRRQRGQRPVDVGQAADAGDDLGQLDGGALVVLADQHHVGGGALDACQRLPAAFGLQPLDMGLVGDHHPRAAQPGYCFMHEGVQRGHALAAFGGRQRRAAMRALAPR
jgi:hypothetical protein